MLYFMFKMDSYALMTSSVWSFTEEEFFEAQDKKPYVEFDCIECGI